MFGPNFDLVCFFYDFGFSGFTSRHYFCEVAGWDQLLPIFWCFRRSLGFLFGRFPDGFVGRVAFRHFHQLFVVRFVLFGDCFRILIAVCHKFPSESSWITSLMHPGLSFRLPSKAIVAWNWLGTTNLRTLNRQPS